MKKIILGLALMASSAYAYEVTLTEDLKAGDVLVITKKPTPTPTPVPTPTPTPINTRGYNPRACGLKNCNVFCKGATPVENLILNGQQVKQYLVPTKYSSLAAAMAAVNDTDLIQDVICVSGILKEKIIPKNGIAKTFVKPKSGNESFDFTYPAAPLLILGWDKDGDGVYPPMDKDDVAEFDGTGMTRWFAPSTAISNVEVAHLTVRNTAKWQTGMPVDGNYLVEGQGSKNIYMHDIEVYDFLRGNCKQSNNHIFAGWSNRVAENFAVENFMCSNCSGYIQRGSHGKKNIRYKNLTITSAPGTAGDSAGCTASNTASRVVASGFKIWGLADFYEVIDSKFDANLGAYKSHPNGSGVFGFNDNVQDVFLKNNLVIDYTSLFVSQPNADDSSLSCKGRFTNRVLLEGNEYQANYCIGGPAAGWPCMKSVKAIQIAPGDSWGWALNMTFKNNKITAKQDSAGSYNFCFGPSNIAIIATAEEKALCPSQTVASCAEAFKGAVIEAVGNTCNIPSKVQIDWQKPEFPERSCSFKDYGTYKIQSTW